jgi:hypothetical protein
MFDARPSCVDFIILDAMPSHRHGTSSKAATAPASIKMKFRKIAVLAVNPADRPCRRAHHDGVGLNDAAELYAF